MTPAPAARHWPFVLMLAAGIGLRVLVMWAYQPAFWYAGDSGSYLARVGRPLEFDGLRALGYVVFLDALRPTGAIVTVVVAQHLLGLAVAVAVYLLLRRRAVNGWLCCAATAPLLFDATLVTMEHYILSETLAIALLVAAVVVLLWRPVTWPVSAAVAGLLLAAAWFVRPLTLPIVIVLVGWLLLAGRGWRAGVAFALAFGVPYLGVLLWVDGRPSPYGSNAIALYGRAAQVADCPNLILSDQERALCAAPGQRPDWYTWSRSSPGHAYVHDPGNPLLRQFAVDVIRQRPGAYLRAVGREVAAHFVGWINPGDVYSCLPGRYAMPVTAREPETGPLGCHPELAQASFQIEPMPRELDPGATPLTTALAGYSRTVTTPRLLLTGTVLLAGVALVAGWRRRPALARDSAMLATAAVAAIVAPVAVGMYDPRYALPALPLLVIAGALAAQCLATLRRRRGSPVSPAVPTDPWPSVAAPPTTDDHR